MPLNTRGKFAEQFKVSWWMHTKSKHSCFSWLARNSSSSAAAAVLDSMGVRVLLRNEQRMKEGNSEGNVARAPQQLNCWDNVVNNFQVEIISFRWAANGATELFWWNCTSTLESRIFFGELKTFIFVFRCVFQFFSTFHYWHGCWRCCVEQQNLSA